MGRPRANAHAQPTTERILTAATRAFAAAGYAGARIEDIARAAKIRRPSLIYHFGSKERLYTRVVELSFERLSEALAAALATPGDLAARLDGLVQSYLDFLEREADFAPLILREILDGQGPGRELILSRAEPLLAGLEEFMQNAGVRVAGDLPVRTALMSLATAATVRAASGPLRDPLFGDAAGLRELGRQLFAPG